MEQKAALWPISTYATSTASLPTPPLVVQYSPTCLVFNHSSALFASLFQEPTDLSLALFEGRRKLSPEADGHCGSPHGTRTQTQQSLGRDAAYALGNPETISKANPCFQSQRRNKEERWFSGCFFQHYDASKSLSLLISLCALRLPYHYF